MTAGMDSEGCRKMPKMGMPAWLGREQAEVKT